MSLFQMSRSNKTMSFLSVALHVVALVSLYGASSHVVAEKIPEPLVVDANILPPPPPQPPIVRVAPEKVKAEPVPTPSVKKPNNPAAAPSKNQTADKPGAEKKSGVDSVAAKNESEIAKGKEGKSESGAATTEGGVAAAIAPSQLLEGLKGASVDAPIRDGGFQIEYNLEIDFNGDTNEGGATFTFKKTNGGNNYEADLIGKVSLLKIGMHSEGEVRSNTLATTRFNGGGGVRGFKSRTGSSLVVEYATQRMTFGKEATQPLAYRAVYDYLSAMVFVQSVLQAKQGRISTMELPVAKTKEIKMAKVTFGAPERLSTHERNGEAGGVFDYAIPAVIAIDSGGLKSMKVWFVPAKNYRPLRIDLVFRDVTAKLTSRQSN